MAGRQFRSILSLCGLTLAGVCAAVAATGLTRLWTRPGTTTAHQPAHQVSSPGSADAVSAGLDPSEKELLWDIEHHGNLLNKFGFKPLADALARADVQGLSEFLATDFSGRIPASSHDLQVTRDFAQVSRMRGNGPESLSLDRSQFIARLIDYRLRFAQPPKVEMKLIRLAPENRKDFQSAWSGSCALRLAGEMGPGEPGEVSLQLQYQIVRPTEENLKKGGWLRL